MSKRYGTAIGIYSIFVQSKFPDASNRLARKRLVQLNHVNILELYARPLEQCRYGEDWADAHFIWRAAFDLRAYKAAQWLKPTFFCP